MSVPLKTLSRAAVSIQTHLQQTSSRPTPPELPEVAWQACQRQLALWERVHSKKWPAASRSCQQILLRTSQDLQRQLQILVLVSELMNDSTSTIATARDIFDDLVALQQEFPKVSISLKKQEISVTTESIELEKIFLGSFEIVLAWKSLPGAAYYVKASEPNPAGRDSETTHPHVQAEKLCEGEGKQAIQATLAAGRLLDFFLIISQTLATYNSGSAYVCLDLWNGMSCCDCEGYVYEDDLCSCDRCECHLCSECSSYCAACDRYCCAECSTACCACGEHFCNSCLEACSSCANHFCERCLSDAKCKSCASKESAEQEPDSAAKTTTAPAC